MDQLRLRLVQNRSEIIDTICKMYLETSDVSIWQSFEDKRPLIPCKISKVDFEKEAVILIPANEEHSFKNFKKDATFYFRGSEKSILFKRDNFHLEDNLIIVKIPQSVRLYEKRDYPRMELKDNSDLVTRVVKKYGDTPHGTKDFYVDLIDISPMGACLDLIPDNGKFFYEGDHFSIQKIMGMKLVQAISATVVYIGKSHNKHYAKNKIKLGIRFDEKIDDKVFSDIEKFAKSIDNQKKAS